MASFATSGCNESSDNTVNGEGRLSEIAGVGSAASDGTFASGNHTDIGSAPITGSLSKIGVPKTLVRVVALGTVFGRGRGGATLQAAGPSRSAKAIACDSFMFVWKRMALKRENVGVFVVN